MRRTTKIWLVTAAFLILIGCMIFGGTMITLNWDFAKLSTSKYETKAHEITQNFNAISIDTDTANLLFMPYEGSKCIIESYEPQNVMHTASVKGDTLIIETIDSRKWYEHIGIHLETPQITIHLPKTEYAALIIKENTGNIEIPESFKFDRAELSLNTGNVRFFAPSTEKIKIKTNTGNIHIENVSAGALDLSTTTGEIEVFNVICESNAHINVSTGKTKLNKLQCKNLTSSGSTGNISLSHVIAAEKLSIQRGTGTVKFDACDAAEVYVKTSTGNVTGAFLSEKIFFAETNTGHIDVPQSLVGGRCEVFTDTGDIKLNIQ